jgi:hypothetical protein
MFPDQFMGWPSTSQPMNTIFETQYPDLLFGFMNDSFLSPNGAAIDPAFSML